MIIAINTEIAELGVEYDSDISIEECIMARDLFDDMMQKLARKALNNIQPKGSQSPNGSRKSAYSNTFDK